MEDLAGNLRRVDLAHACAECGKPKCRTSKKLCRAVLAAHAAVTERARRGHEAVAGHGGRATLRQLLEGAAVLAAELEGQPHPESGPENLRDLLAAAALELGGLA